MALETGSQSFSTKPKNRGSDRMWSSIRSGCPERMLEAKELCFRSGKARCLAMLILGTFAVVCTGCSLVGNSYNAIARSGTWDDTMITLRNRSFSAKAWHRRKHQFCREKYVTDFCAGFRAGYEEVASGGDGCTPAFPPNSYRGWQHQSAEGQSKTQAWFAGYPHGARAAEEDGVVHWNQVPMSSGVQAQYQQAGVFDHDGALYPIPELATSHSPKAVTLPEGDIPLPHDALDGIVPGSLKIVPEVELPVSTPQNGFPPASVR